MLPKLIWLGALGWLSLPLAGQTTPGLQPQFPSPMVEYTRAHQRLALTNTPAVPLELELPGGRRAKVVWSGGQPPRVADCIFHFHGDVRVAQQALRQQRHPVVLVHLHWGNGSGAYSRPWQEYGPAALMDTLLRQLQAQLPSTKLRRLWLSSWSAGYGALRSILADTLAAARFSGVLLLDGLHCAYQPEGQVLAAGGTLDTLRLAPFVRWAERALLGRVVLQLTHSAVFPGTYASTTETADYLLGALHLSRQPRLARGPLGMQQTSRVRRGRLELRSYAGNSAPDHIDHYHALGWFWRDLLRQRGRIRERR